LKKPVHFWVWAATGLVDEKNRKVFSDLRKANAAQTWSPTTNFMDSLKFPLTKLMFCPVS
jgi:hypothetical protein